MDRTSSARSDRVVIVTGAGQGIGAAVATELADVATTVALVDLNQDSLRSTADDIAARGHRAVPYTVDVTDRAAVDQLVESAEAELGPVEVVVNAAGVPRMAMSAYAASKAAATHFTKCLGLELAEHGIRCNVVSPGSTDTEMQRSMWGADGAGAVVTGDPGSYKTGIPLGRVAEATDISDAVAFLVSERARHITLHDLYVDGGATLRA